LSERRVVVGIIPCRMGSTRFPGKPLVRILGRPMVEHVYRRAERSPVLSRLVVATDSLEIKRVVESFGGEVVMTGSGHRTGTDRVAEAAGKIPADIIVNIQGDEPALEPRMIDQAVSPLLDDDSVLMSTLIKRITDKEDLLNPSLARVVVDGRGDALYFSRALIPFVRDGLESLSLEERCFFKHVGIYVFRRDFLFTFAGLPPTPLETAEGLEMLRALEHGYRIRTVVTEYDSRGVDTPEDLKRVEALLRDGGETG